MKRQRMVLFALIGLLLTGITFGSKQVWAASGQDQSNSSYTYHVQGGNRSPCTGYAIAYEGDVVVHTHSVTDGTGVVHNSFHTQYTLTGVEETTGTIYHVQEAFQDTYVYRSAGSLETYINNLHFIAQGPGNNFFYVDKMHYTVNANGETTAYSEFFESQCR